MKRAISAVLANYKDYVYYHMPVPTGYGTSTLDYIGVCCARGFAIEAKREKGRPTLRQIGVIGQMERAGVRVFVINSPETLEELNQWLAATTGSGEDQHGKENG
jgi:hypothetical protein